MPVYNERTTVEEIIRRVLAVPLRIELIVVDDGSKDGSGEILDRLAKDGLVSSHGRDTVLWMSRQQSG